MKKYTITGMSCAACSARVEKAVSSVEGVTSCSVSLLTNSMGVEGSASESAIIKAVTAAGYGAVPANKAAASPKNDDNLSNESELSNIKHRLAASLVFLLILMYISMGHSMLGLPLPQFMADNNLMNGLAQLLLAAIVMVINQKFFINGTKGLIHRSPNMDTLVAMGSMAAFVYSTWSLFAMTDAQVKGDIVRTAFYSHELYFESAAMILTLITVGKLLETRSKGKTTDALKSLIKLSPKTANVIRDGVETEITADEVVKGDIFIVRPGQSIPVDGIVLEGESAVNESAITGESIPVDKKAGSTVTSATINSSGFLKCEATRVGTDTTISQIIKLVSDAAATKAPIAKTADKVSGIFVPAVIIIAVITLIIWLIVGKSAGFALARAISVLVISCPCALGLATPVAIMVGSGTGARNGILFKNAVSLEQTGKVSIVALDKTGTITAGEPVVTDIIPAHGYTENELLSIALALEIHSEHPLAKAVINHCNGKNLTFEEVTAFRSVSGNGLTAEHNGIKISGGNYSFISSVSIVPDDMKKAAEMLSSAGKTPLLFSKGEKSIGLIAVADVIREDSIDAIKQMKKMGIRTIMLTGDNEITAKAIGEQAGVDEIIAGVLPDEKEAAVRSLKKQGVTAMVGDGINDAPALTSADMGIAVGAGTDVAIDAADVVLMKSSLIDVPAAIRLSRATLRNIKQNLFWAFCYNIIGIPLAAGAYIKLFGWELNPMFGAAAMGLSSFCVVTNALRLNMFNPYDASRDKKQSAHVKTEVNSDSSTEKTIKIKGMMCEHCEARVKKALEELNAVKSAEVSHKSGTAVAELCSDISDTELKQAVEDAGYKVTKIV
ncbi:heavy metal translocating P-type ATPase [Ruminococcus sp.]|uniref:heavy metal translocating P-type ATPase n=1 Tax=Ruminococcus sp. TaxID=41978 RepID=UPI0025F7BB7E|nr:heavy metal translocating P-type ATPase [Ruminococcus sp.]